MLTLAGLDYFGACAGYNSRICTESWRANDVQHRASSSETQIFLVLSAWQATIVA